MRRLVSLLVLATVLAALPVLALPARGFWVDCFTWNPTVCTDDSCTTYTCDQCDYDMDDEYLGSDHACY